MSQVSGAGDVEPLVVVKVGGEVGGCGRQPESVYTGTPYTIPGRSAASSPSHLVVTYCSPPPGLTLHTAVFRTLWVLQQLV